MSDPRTEPQYKLRLPADLLERIRSAAEMNRRSMNAEMVARLEATFRVGPTEEPISNETIKEVISSYNRGLLPNIEGVVELDYDDKFQKVIKDLDYIKNKLALMDKDGEMSKIIPGEHIERLDEYMNSLPEPRPGRADTLRYVIKRGLDVLMGTRKSERMRA